MMNKNKYSIEPAEKLRFDRENTDISSVAFSLLFPIGLAFVHQSGFYCFRGSERRELFQLICIVNHFDEFRMDSSSILQQFIAYIQLNEISKIWKITIT